MARLPISKGDPDQWGTLLNEFLAVAHDDEGNIKSEILDAKANVDEVVFLTTNQTIGGTKNFSTNIRINNVPIKTNTEIDDALALKATDTNVVHNTGVESIAGQKTFITAPVVPNDSFAQSKVINLTTDLADKASTSTLTAHTSASTSVHGIANTANLETTTGAQTKVNTHVNDATAAHAATAIAFTPYGSIAATTVQAAIQEVLDEIPVGGADTSQVITVASSGSSQTIDISEAAQVLITLTDDCTIDLTDWPASVAHDVLIVLTQNGGGGHTVTWSDVEFEVEPIIDPAANAVTKVLVSSVDSGTTQIGTHTQKMKTVTWGWNGNFATSTNANRFYFRRPSRIIACRFSSDEEPTGTTAAVVNMIHGFGVSTESIYPNAGARLTIPVGQFDSGETTSHTITDMAIGDWVKPQITQIGDTLPGGWGTVLMHFLEG